MADYYENMQRWRRWRCPGVCSLHDDRLIRLFKRTWDRLLPHDRRLLRAVVGWVRERHEDDYHPDSMMGHADQLPGESVEGGMAYIADGDYEIALAPDLCDEYTESAVIGLIAHELALAALRHVATEPSRRCMRAARPEEYKVLTEAGEWEADHRAWVWGFSVEILALQEATYPHDNPWMWVYEEQPTAEGE